MNKTQLIETIAEKAGISKGEAKRGLDAFVDTVFESLSEGDKVAVMGFGTFQVERKKARMGRDPRNGAPIKIAAKNVVKFKPGQELSEQIR